MYGYLARHIVRRLFDRLQDGDVQPVVAIAADDIHFRFPGRSPWSADHRSKGAFVLWMERFAHFRPKLELHDVVAAGPPWNVRISTEFTQRIGQPGDGADGVPYVNRAVCALRLRWLRITEACVYVDTQAVAEFFGKETAEEFFAS